MEITQAGQNTLETELASFSASEILGSDVINPEDEALGTIEDIMISRCGKIAYLVLSYGGIFGTTFGDKRFALPFQLFTVTHRDGELQFILDVDKRRLEKAPGFDKDRMPDFADASFSNKINHYYGDYMAHYTVA